MAHSLFAYTLGCYTHSQGLYIIVVSLSLIFDKIGRVCKNYIFKTLNNAIIYMVVR